MSAEGMRREEIKMIGEIAELSNAGHEACVMLDAAIQLEFLRTYEYWVCNAGTGDQSNLIAARKTGCCEGRQREGVSSECE